MNAFVDGAWRLLADATLRAALVAAAAWVVLAVWRPRNASVRHGVWTAALVAMLLLPGLTLVAPRVPAPMSWSHSLIEALRLTLQDVAGASTATRRELADLASRRVASPEAGGGYLHPSDAPGGTPTPATVVQALRPSPAPGGEAVPSADASTAAGRASPTVAESVVTSGRVAVDPWRSIAVGVYFTGALVLGLRLLAGVHATRRIVSQARYVDVGENQGLLPPGTRVLEAAAVRVPVAAGVRRPVVLLPADWRSWSEPLLVCALAHEGAHLRRRDTLVAALAAVNGVIYWFHPAAWLVQRKLATLAEQVCDDAVIESTGRRTEYARGLVEMAGRVSGGMRRAAPAGVAMARRAQVEDRVEAIIDEARPLARRMDAWRAAAIAAVAAPLVLVAAGLRSAAQTAEPQRQGTATIGAADDAAVAEPAKDADRAAPVLEGRLTDPSGAPVTDAQIDLYGPESHEAKTDADGHYQFDRIKQAGDYRLIIESKRWVGFTRTNVAPQLKLTEKTHLVRDFTLLRACVVRVQVVDEAGKPITAVRLYAAEKSDDMIRGTNGIPSSGVGPDKEGWAEIGGIPPSKIEYVIGAMSKEYAFGLLTVKCEDSSVTTLQSLTLPRGVEVRGKAICADGKPAAGWSIVAMPTWWTFGVSNRGALVGEDGSFVLTHVGADRYNLQVSVPEGNGMSRSTVVQSDVELPPASGELDLKLNMASPQGMGAIAGRVRLVGEPLAENIEVTAQAEVGREIASSFIQRGGNAFRLGPMPPGRYRVRFSSPGIEEKVVENVTAPVDNLDVELKAVGRPTLRGRVTLADGTPATQFRVRVEKVRTLRGPNYVPDAQWQDMENAAGEFELKVPGPGVYRLVAEAQGTAATRSAEINTDGYDGQPVPIVLTAGATVSGTVVDEQGQAIAGARVMPLSRILTSREQRSIDVAALSVETDAQGRFRLERLTPGPEMIRASHADYAFTTTEPLTLAAGDNSLKPIVLAEGGSVRGRVFDENGRPQAGVTLYFRKTISAGESEAQKLYGEFGSAVSDAEGWYQADRLPTELCYVSRSDPWGALGVVRQAILPTNKESRRLDLGGKTPVRGRLVVNGKPVASARIQLSDQPNFGAFKAYAMTDAEGRFTFWSPDAGERKLYYEAPGRRNEWVMAAKLTIAPSNAQIGDVAVQASRVSIALRGLSVEQAQGANVTLQTFDPIWTHGDDAGLPTPRAGADAPYVFENVLPGEYEAVWMRQDYVRLRQRVTAPATGEAIDVTMEWPAGGASIAGRIAKDAMGPGDNHPPNLWSKDGRILASLFTRSGDRYQLVDLPAGEYFLTSWDVREAPAVLTFSLAAGERKTLDLTKENYAPAPFAEGALDVRCFTDEGVPLPGCKITLVREGGTLRPHSSQEGRVMFIGAPGTYRMRVEFQGMEPVERDVKLVPAAPDGRLVGDFIAEVRMHAAR